MQQEVFIRGKQKVFPAYAGIKGIISNGADTGLCLLFHQMTVVFPCSLLARYEV